MKLLQVRRSAGLVVQLVLPNLCASRKKLTNERTVEHFAECLLNRYEPGAIIQPHLDKPVWEHVICVSLGAPATMIFRHQEMGEERSVALPPRSMYVLVCLPRCDGLTKRKT